MQTQEAVCDAPFPSFHASPDFRLCDSAACPACNWQLNLSIQGVGTRANVCVTGSLFIASEAVRIPIPFILPAAIIHRFKYSTEEVFLRYGCMHLMLSELRLPRRSSRCFARVRRISEVEGKLPK
jgi:hypothetical protein